MDLQALQQKKQQYLNEKNNLEIEKNNYIKELAVIENQIQTNDNILMTQFGTKDPAQLQEILNNLENELQQLESQYSDLKSGKISASSFGDTSTQQFQNETKPNTDTNYEQPKSFAPPSAPLMQPTPPIPGSPTQLVQQPNYPAEQLQPQLVQQPNYPNMQPNMQQYIQEQNIAPVGPIPQAPNAQNTSITPPPPPVFNPQTQN